MVLLPSSARKAASGTLIVPTGGGATHRPAYRYGRTVGTVAERCESCGGDATDAVAVHRMYVTPAAWDTEEKVEVLDSVERWCSPCRTHYPHQELALDE